MYSMDKKKAQCNDKQNVGLAATTNSLSVDDKGHVSNVQGGCMGPASKTAGNHTRAK
jgi:hypothetical protein